jgi:hypothetical protein
MMALAGPSTAFRAGRLIGVAAAAGVVALWGVFLFRNPYASPAQDRTFLIGVTMMIGGAIAAAAAAYGAHLAMYLLFFVMFFPLGLYVWLTPGVFSAIGWLQLAYLGAAVLVHLGILQAKRKGPVGD